MFIFLKNYISSHINAEASFCLDLCIYICVSVCWYFHLFFCLKIGIIFLFCRNLKCLNISNCTQIKKGEVVCSYLEELIPDLTIIGLDTLPVLAEDWATSEIQHNRFMYLGSSVDPVNTSDIVVENDSKDTHPNEKGPQVEEYEGIISLMKRSLYAPNWKEVSAVTSVIPIQI